MVSRKSRRKANPMATIPEDREPIDRVNHDSQVQMSTRTRMSTRSQTRTVQQERSCQQDQGPMENQQVAGQQRLYRIQRTNEGSNTSLTERGEGVNIGINQGYPENVQGRYMNRDQREGQGVSAYRGILGHAEGQNYMSGPPLAIQAQAALTARLRQSEQQLPEPPLTAVLHKEKPVGAPAVSQWEISRLLAQTEQYLSVLRLNQGPQNEQLGRSSAIQARLPGANYTSNGNQANQGSRYPVIDTSNVPRIENTENALGDDPRKLPSVAEQLFKESEAVKRAYKRRLQAVKDRHSQLLADAAPNHASGVMNTRAAPRIGADTENRMPMTRGIRGLQGRVLKTTPKTIRPHRLWLRGPSQGYRSFGDLVQADMPSPSLEHFSIMKLSRTASECGPARVCRHSESRFSIFQELLKRPELIINLASHLRVQELLILYRISKPFHSIINQRFTTVILSQAMRRAPESARIFPFRCYSSLCIDDPGQRPHPVAQLAATGQHRKVPSFRWLLMLCFREMVCHEIRMIMAEDGTPLPEQCESVMKKIWFVMDIPDNARRIGMIQNREIFTDADLFFATMFFVKMDMRFTDPLTGSGRDGMRRMLLSQPSLSTFWKALRRTALVSKVDAVKMYIRWKWQPPARLAGQPVFDVPANEIGIIQYEGWGRTGSRVPLQRPDEIILKESIHRNLNLRDAYTDMFLWGYVNPRDLQDIPPVPERRDLERLGGMEDLLISDEEKRNRNRANNEKLVSRRVTFS
ncbi:hypothetical protein PRK78_001581 [Emydomyces testavorans]|uniref:F-box domain-containing protein n=1 Tax=Emydomyces testavorans TaxID=2070801 RepID=A0AAF0DCR0_9EURO|nr:hypothetical protein PRK78_001581 [Emydomyces testavorans]